MIYYLDSIGGSDDNDGLSRQTAFRTLEKLNALTLQGGDRVLFKAGCQFPGVLSPKREPGNGVIVLGRYGTGEAPLIAGEGEVAVDLQDIGFVEVRGLAVTAPNGAYGIRICNTAGGETEHVHIVGCHIYDVYGAHERFSICTGGIVITTGRENPAWYRDLLIEDNHIHDVCRTGVILHTYWSNRPWKTWAENDYVSDTENWWPSYEVVFRGNLIERPAGDAMVLIGAVRPLMEWNTAYHVMNDPKPPCANAGIWPQSTEGCVVQYNEVGYAHKPEGCDDAQGFDVDLSCRDTIVQYNYSHDNEGGFLLLCELGGTAEYGYRGTVVRNNLSVNDGNTKGELISLVGPVRGATVENNTICSSGNVERIVEVWTKDGTDQAKDVVFRNNLFVSNGKGCAFNVANGEDFRWEGNLYAGRCCTPPEGENHPLVADPLLPPDEKAVCGRLAGEQYVPLSGSVALNGGRVTPSAQEDFFGNRTGDTPYIGAFAGGKKG